jgi:hypothetical protein
MAADAGSGTETIYVRLLDEGTDVWRPTTAVRLPDGTFELLPTGDHGPAIETWEFPAGSVVECEVRDEGPDRIRVATRLASRQTPKDIQPLEN